MTAAVFFISGDLTVTNEELVFEIQQGNDKKQNLERLYNKNRGLIWKAANRLSGFSDIDDLTQEGYIALQEAAERFTPEGDATFASYAYKCICGRLLTYLRDNQHAVHLSADMYEKVLRYKKLCEAHAKTTGEELTRAGAAVLLGVRRVQADAIAQAASMTSLRSLSAPIPGGEDLTLEDTVPDQTDQIGQLMEALADQKENRRLWECVDKLGDRKAKILREHYQRRRPLSSIAHDVGISSARAAQEHASALKILKRMKAVREISEHYNFFFGTTAALFRKTWTSQPEFYVMRLEEMGEPPSEYRSEPPNRQTMD